MAGKSGKLIGVDYGDARIGIASSDELGMFASPLETIQVSKGDPLARIVKIVAQKKAKIVVIGQPLRMDGSVGESAKKVQAFIKKLKKALPKEIKIVEIDERLTTKEAQDILEKAGKKPTKENKNNQDIIDQVAAALILQDYIDNSEDVDDDDDTDAYADISGKDNKDDLVAFKDFDDDDDDFGLGGGGGGGGGGWGGDDDDNF
ncbi:MAG: Holliday junction resolvase RuvX [Verrucomicrobiales bacterium]|nr:Holliday junction resolvase RuvX [Verrucomicrobiales bacterium]